MQQIEHKPPVYCSPPARLPMIGSCPTVSCPEEERVRGPMPFSVAIVAFCFGIVCRSTISRPDTAVESLVVTRLTHYFAVEIYQPKTEHISRNQNAQHSLAERTTNRQNRTAWSVLTVVDGMPLNTHGGVHPRRTMRHDVQNGQIRVANCPGSIVASWLLCPA